MLLVEVGLRVLDHESSAGYVHTLGREKVRQPFPGVRYVFHGHSSYSQTWPNNPRGYFDQETSSLIYRTNNYGFRDDDFSLARNEKIRVLFLGDSFCWGIGVQRSDLFATLIEQRLNETKPLGSAYEIYNACLPGYSTGSEAALYSEALRHFRPDVLVVWYFLNDVNQERDRYVRLRRPAGNPRPRSRFFGLLQDAVRQLSAHQELVEEVGAAYGEGHPGLSGLEDALRHIHRVGREDGVIRILAILPWLYRLDGEDYPFLQAHSVVGERAAREGFEILDLVEVFSGSLASELWVHPVDHHPNEIGHAMIAKAAADFLESRLLAADQALLVAAGTRRKQALPASLEGPPPRDWYRPFINLDREGG